jgi:acyl-CoA reductase-like NAD-dependent aldehyde dehydrogenase
MGDMATGTGTDTTGARAVSARAHDIETIANHIDGRWQDALRGGRIEHRDPATGRVVASVPESTTEDIDAAVAAARRAFAHWRLVPAPRRAEIFYRAAEILTRRKEQLARRMTEDMGKVLEESRGEVQEGIDMVYYMAGEGRRLLGETMPAELPNKFAMVVRDPIGVVAAITPWNFPFSIPTWKLCPALIAGNTAVFKPSSDAPRLARDFVEILVEAGLPDGVLNLVYSAAPSVGDALVRHPQVDAVSFTGSTAVGKQVAATASGLMKRVSVELGGKNAVIVLDDADLDLATDAIVWGAFGTTGQRCTATSRVIVERSVKEALEARLCERARALRIGNGLDAGVEVGPVIHRAALEKIERYVAIGKEEGARLIAGGSRVERPDLAGGHYFAPTIFTDVRPEMRIAREEIFGPVLAILPVDGLDQAIEVMNGVPYGLSGSIFTQNVNRAFRAIRDIAVGILYVNAGTTGAEIQTPFGGTRETGNGHREAGTAGIDFFTELKAVYVDYSGRLQRAQIDLDLT